VPHASKAASAQRSAICIRDCAALNRVCVVCVWQLEGGRAVFLVFKGFHVWEFERDEAGKGSASVIRDGPRAIPRVIIGGPDFVEFCAGPLQLLHQADGAWRHRTVIYFFSEGCYYEWDTATRQSVKRRIDLHPAIAPPTDAAAEPPMLAEGRVASSIGSRLPSVIAASRLGSRVPSTAAPRLPSTEFARSPSAVGSTGGVSAVGDALHRRASVVSATESLQEATVRLFDPLLRRFTRNSALQPWAEGQRTLCHVVLEGIVPGCGEVLGHYTLVQEVFGQTDRPLYFHRHSAGKEAFLFWRFAGTSRVDGDGWWVVADEPGAEEGTLCIRSDSGHPAVPKPPKRPAAPKVCTQSQTPET
jgi:hypothetical protein